jgi:hypothetical protein
LGAAAEAAKQAPPSLWPAARAPGAGPPGMEALLAAVALLAAALAVLLVLRSKRAAFKAHVDTLGRAPPRKRRELVVGTWSRAEVARHAAADDLWLIIRDKKTGEARVYDMTDYVEEHPGGMAILNNAGGDATEGFHGPQHPPTVFDLLGDYWIGTLADP